MKFILGIALLLPLYSAFALETIPFNCSSENISIDGVATIGENGVIATADLKRPDLEEKMELAGTAQKFKKTIVLDLRSMNIDSDSIGLNMVLNGKNESTYSFGNEIFETITLKCSVVKSGKKK